MDLTKVATSFGSPGTRHRLAMLNDDVWIQVLDSEVVNSGRNENKQLNFMVLKLLLLPVKMAISIKIFVHGYFQIFGLSDVKEIKAEDMGRTILFFVSNHLRTKACVDAITGVGELSIMALSAMHKGLSAFGFRFDLEALEALLSLNVLVEASGGGVSKNPRNHSIVLRKGEKEGSMIFHGTGSIQLMGWRTEPSEALERLRKLFKGNAQVITRVHPLDMMGKTAKRSKKKRVEPEGGSSSSSSSDISSSDNSSKKKKRRTGQLNNKTKVQQLQPCALDYDAAAKMIDEIFDLDVVPRATETTTTSFLCDDPVIDFVFNFDCEELDVSQLMEL